MKQISYGLILFGLLSCINAANNKRATSDGAGPRDQRQTPNAGTKDTTLVYKSQSYRTIGKEQLSYDELGKKITTSTTDLDYRTIPRIDTDHDGQVEMNKFQQKNCGIVVETKTIKSRKNNCVQQNPNDSVWSAKENGISGEGDWALVYKQDAVTVWQDLTTGLLWSTPLKTAAWKEASGAEVDEEDYICGNSKLLEGEVKWMLPTRNEFLQADINGARFVLPSTSEIFWTASRQGQTDNAWAIMQSTGELTAMKTSRENEVRCVGIPLK